MEYEDYPCDIGLDSGPVTVADIATRLGLEFNTDQESQIEMVIQSAYALISECLCGAVDRCNPAIRTRVIEMIARGLVRGETFGRDNDPCNLPCPLEFKLQLFPDECERLHKAAFCGPGFAVHCLTADPCCSKCEEDEVYDSDCGCVPHESVVA